jgi:hypothetical protein
VTAQALIEAAPPEPAVKKDGGNVTNVSGLQQTVRRNRKKIRSNVRKRF